LSLIWAGGAVIGGYLGFICSHLYTNDVIPESGAAVEEVLLKVFFFYEKTTASTKQKTKEHNQKS